MAALELVKDGQKKGIDVSIILPSLTNSLRSPKGTWGRFRAEGEGPLADGSITTRNDTSRLTDRTVSTTSARLRLKMASASMVSLHGTACGFIVFARYQIPRRVEMESDMGGEMGGEMYRGRAALTSVRCHKPSAGANATFHSLDTRPSGEGGAVFKVGEPLGWFDY